LSFSAHFVKLITGKVFPTLRKTQRVNLAYGVFGQIKTQSGFMSEIVRVIPGADKHKHRLKRFWRFLSNPRWNPAALRLYWIRWCLNVFVHTRIIPVAMDWATLPGNIQCLMIAIPFKGRAIPLIWQVVLHSQIKDSQNLIEERLLARLINVVHDIVPDKKLLVTADRGFGRTTLFQFLRKKQVLFVIRVKGDVMITTRQGERFLLSNRGKTLTENKPVWYQGITYRGDGKVTGVNLVCVVAPPQEEGSDPDPWFLVTNLRKAETGIQRYAERFHIEEWFKDLKHQLGVRELQTRNLMRVRRLLFIACLAYGLTMLVGTMARRLTTIQDHLITGGKQVASRIWFAIKIIRQKLCGSLFWRRVYAVATVP
jgi:Transposase DDE domain group 1